MLRKSLDLSMRRLLSVLLMFAPFLLAALARAQGGPPFITDDPGTPGNHHWEINFGWIANHNPGQSYYEIPDIDMNYGWGDRIQLKYELPLAAGTDANNSTGVGLGESYPGIKWRYFEYHRAGQPKTDENLLFSLGTYPQVMINNPTSSVRRGLVEPGPQYYLPIEATAQLGWLSLNGEVGRWIGNKNMPDQWGRGLIAGHEFNDRTAGHQSHRRAASGGPTETAFFHARSRRPPDSRPLRPPSPAIYEWPRHPGGYARERRAKLDRLYGSSTPDRAERKRNARGAALSSQFPPLRPARSQRPVSEKLRHKSAVQP
jgi:hypothetical protein